MLHRIMQQSFPQGLISIMMFIQRTESRPRRVITSLVVDLITLAETHLERKPSIFISLKEPLITFHACKKHRITTTQ